MVRGVGRLSGCGWSWTKSKFNNIANGTLVGGVDGAGLRASLII
jgi:hypothetical protein